MVDPDPEVSGMDSCHNGSWPLRCSLCDSPARIEKFTDDVDQKQYWSVTCRCNTGQYAIHQLMYRALSKWNELQIKLSDELGQDIYYANRDYLFEGMPHFQRGTPALP